MGYDLRKLPLIERKKQLTKIVKGSDIQFSESFEIDGKENVRSRLQGRAGGRRLQGAISATRWGAAATGSRQPAPSARL
jgi:bifunctional non-homologous end joining protein LigD